jgi:hypothetical protein
LHGGYLQEQGVCNSAASTSKVAFVSSTKNLYLLPKDQPARMASSSVPLTVTLKLLEVTDSSFQLIRANFSARRWSSLQNRLSVQLATLRRLGILLATLGENRRSVHPTAEKRIINEHFSALADLYEQVDQIVHGHSTNEDTGLLDILLDDISLEKTVGLLERQVDTVDTIAAALDHGSS